MPDVELALLSTLRMTRSDSTGAFGFYGIAPGTYILRARRAGCSVSTQDVVVKRDSATSIHRSVELQVGAQVLAEVTVRVQRMRLPTRYAEAYWRLSKGRGAYFPLELIDGLRRRSSWSRSTVRRAASRRSSATTRAPR